jgi:hypothetical protein
MKYLWLVLFPFCLFGFYTGNPLSPAMLNKGLFGRRGNIIAVGVGYLADFLTDRDMALDGDPSDVNVEAGHNFSMESQMSSLSIHLVRRLEVYGYLGSSSEKLDYFPIVGTKQDLKARSHFSYVIGAKAILLDFSRFVLSVDYSYFCLPSTSKLRKKIEGISFPEFIPIPLGSQRLNYRQWQVAAGLSARLGPLSPYVGGKYSQAKLKVTIEKDSPVRFRGKDHWGLFAGLSITLSSSFFVSGELRWFDETAYSTAAVFAF